MNIRTDNRMTRAGFTLIEMILVVVIIALMAALVLPNLLDRPDQARRAAADAQIQTFKTGLNFFQMDLNRLPTTEEGLQALVEKPAGLGEDANWQGYLDEPVVPKDPWGNEYVYRNPGRVNTDGYDLFSPGPDGELGTEDDIGNTSHATE